MDKMQSEALRFGHELKGFGLSLDEFFSPLRASRFLIEMDSEAMMPLIHKGDKVLVDRSLVISQNKLGVFYWQDRFVLRRYIKHGGSVFLQSENPVHVNLKLGQEDELQLWGVVCSIHRKL